MIPKFRISVTIRKRRQKDADGNKATAVWTEQWRMLKQVRIGKKVNMPTILEQAQQGVLTGERDKVIGWLRYVGEKSASSPCDQFEVGLAFELFFSDKSTAIEYYERSCQLDDSFILPVARLAECYDDLGYSTDVCRSTLDKLNALMRNTETREQIDDDSWKDICRIYISLSPKYSAGFAKGWQ
jgi:hypothetical protein